jgi:hypothetical protein
MFDVFRAAAHSVWMDRFRPLLDRLRSAALASGELDAAIARKASDAPGEVPESVRDYTLKVRHEAHKVTDEDIAGLRDAGFSEDQIFELTVAVALGAGLSRLEIASRALAGTDRRDKESS